MVPREETVQFPVLQICNSQVRKGVRYLPAGLRLWGVWMGSCKVGTSGCASMFESRSGLQYFPLAYESSFGIQIFFIN